MRKLAFHADNLRGFVTRSFPKNVREGGTPDEAVRIFAWEAIEREKLLFSWRGLQDFSRPVLVGFEIMSGQTSSLTGAP